MNRDILYPLRRLHGWLHEWKLSDREKNRFCAYLKKPKGKKAVILGTPSHTNVGDSAIVLAEMNFLKRCGFAENQIKEVPVASHCLYEKVIHRIIRSLDCVFWHGGGNMGDIWPAEEVFRQEILAEYPQLPILQLPQTIDYRDDCKENELRNASLAVYNHERMTIVARERRSFDVMQSMYPRATVLLTPDIVLSTTCDDFGVKQQTREGILLCMRSDIERNMSDEDRKVVEGAVERSGIRYTYIDMHADVLITRDSRRDFVRKKMQEFAGARLVITDRLHGMVFAAITGTPCIVFSNYNHKVRGTYEWIRYLPYIRYAESASDVETYLPELLAMKDCIYDNKPLLPYFDELAKVVKQYGKHECHRPRL